MTDGQAPHLSLVTLGGKEKDAQVEKGPRGKGDQQQMKMGVCGYLQCCDELKLVCVPTLQGLVFTSTEHQVSVGYKLFDGAR